MVGTIPRMAYVLLVLLDRHRHLGICPARPVRKVPTPPQLGLTANSVITMLSRTQLELLHAKHVPQERDLTYSRKGRNAKPVSQGGI
jgi:hypothetical protein